jgi:hypothetical protein
MQKSALLVAIQAQINRHDFSRFIDELPAIAQCGRGVVVAGCPTPFRRFQASDRLLAFLDLI